ncbi:MAG: DUF6591 domain-containing protein [Acutalibacteraceae bacterium]|nr:DUF6591 domain-containing protein [Acutalibacteraceae bacterium]
MNEQINPQGTFVPAKCPNCGGEFPVNPSQECCVCQFCQQPVITANAMQNYQANHSNDRAGFVAAPPVPPQEPPKKKHTLLWVLGWIFCFPIPLTILMLRNKTLNNKVRYGIIAAGWIVYLLIMVIPRTGGNRGAEQPQETPQKPVVTERVPDESNTKKTTKPAAETTAPTTTEPVDEAPAETELPAEESAEQELSAQDIQDMVTNGDYSLVTPEFKAFMDSYEAFYDNYIAFMQKYNSGEGDMMAMLNDYMTMMTELQEWTEKIDAIDEKTLSPADDAYYLLVTLGIEKKLLSAM